MFGANLYWFFAWTFCDNSFIYQYISVKDPGGREGLTSPPPLRIGGARREKRPILNLSFYFQEDLIKIVFDEMTKFHECYLKISIISPIPSENAVSRPWFSNWFLLKYYFFTKKG